MKIRIGLALAPLLAGCACADAPSVHAQFILPSSVAISGPVALVHEHDGEHVVAGSYDSAGGVQEIAVLAGGESITPVSSPWAPELGGIDSIAVVDVEPDGDEELLVHSFSRGADEQLVLVDPEDGSVATLVSVSASAGLYGALNDNLVAAHNATGAPLDLLALLRLPATDPAAPDASRSLTVYALTRDAIARMRSQTCSEYDSCLAPFRVGASSGLTAASGLQAVVSGTSGEFRAFYATPTPRPVHQDGPWSLGVIECQVQQAGITCQPPSELVELPFLGAGPASTACNEAGECAYVSAPAASSSTAELRVIEPSLSARTYSGSPAFADLFAVRSAGSGALRAFGTARGTLFRVDVGAANVLTPQAVSWDAPQGIGQLVTRAPSATRACALWWRTDTTLGRARELRLSFLD